MNKTKISLSSFLNWSCKMAGKPISFILAILFLVFWCIIGLFIGYTQYWFLIINTLATVNASLMVFIILNTQNRESKALHIKIDELIRSSEKASLELIAIEEKEEQELEAIRKKLSQREEK